METWPNFWVNCLYNLPIVYKRQIFRKVVVNVIIID